MPITWSDVGKGRSELRFNVREFLYVAGAGRWSVAWCAGAGAINAPSELLEDELTALRETLESLGEVTGKGEGTFFFASSAGAVYAGVDAPPYNESSPVRPLTAYGRAKLEAEALISEWSIGSGTPALIGRISNLYGPGQNVFKAQGLISQICRSYLVDRPLLIYVPLDTLRDYLFAPDCASLIVDGLARLRRQRDLSSSMVVTKILASQRAITVGAVLGEVRRIFKKPPRIVIGASSASAAQVRDLSLLSVVWPDLDRRALTPFPVGVAATTADLRRRLQRAEL